MTNVPSVRISAIVWLPIEVFLIVATVPACLSAGRTVYCTSAYPQLHWRIVIQWSSVEDLLALDGPSPAGICNVKTLPRYHPKTRAESVESGWAHLDHCELSLCIATLEGHTQVMISHIMHNTRSARRAVWVLKLRYATPSVISRHNSGSAN